MDSKFKIMKISPFSNPIPKSESKIRTTLTYSFIFLFGKEIMSIPQYNSSKHDGSSHNFCLTSNTDYTSEYPVQNQLCTKDGIILRNSLYAQPKKSAFEGKT